MGWSYFAFRRVRRTKIAFAFLTSRRLTCQRKSRSTSGTRFTKDELLFSNDREREEGGEVESRDAKSQKRNDSGWCQCQLST